MWNMAPNAWKFITMVTHSELFELSIEFWNDLKWIFNHHHHHHIIIIIIIALIIIIISSSSSIYSFNTQYLQLSAFLCQW
jgi:hypothetical protein